MWVFFFLLLLALGQNGISDQINERTQCDSSLYGIFFPNLLPCNTKSFDREIRNDDEFAYRQESAVHVSDDQTAAAFFHI